MTPLYSLTDPAPVSASAAAIDDEFRLDLRIIESAGPLLAMMCDTSDNCGSTCSTTACNTSSNDPF
jgi:FxLD family lantipeptide